MRLPMTKPLFARDCLEDCPSLAGAKELVDAARDAKLIASLRDWRGRGRDDYPVEVLWRTIGAIDPCARVHHDRRVVRRYG